ncbi:DUF3006 domain-containing protein [Patescibacteria group bacterium]|nr:DUF3006 domain-containing protein [Patescibacteria group bacterium]MBU1662993.1 DUF3006 domain-containing protein [Patescibacteria group bacterium]MBU1934183.1 DUF3006 domain-containing protein [Patescibacteria group bacterium]MBU2008168.1 DUF3006 domain-containing protein [Patescibacteria group bacterium]MBU2233649.1 DUF3006 domain-containing protein [Patescibacteria group bacterium]
MSAIVIKLTIDRFEEDKAILVADDGTAIIWPKNKLPTDVHEGSVLSLDIREAIEREKLNKQTAKDIINEIINRPVA